MEFADVVRSRRMVRSYQPGRPISRQTIDSLLGLAVRAPSAGHTQGWRFLVLDDPEGRERFWTVTTEPGVEDDWLRRLRTAPALVVVFSSKDAYLDRYAEPDKGWTDRDEARWPVPYWHIDAGMAAVIFLLAAVDAGLGACFFGIPPERVPDLRTEFAVGSAWSPIGVISLGYPAPDVRSPSLRRGRKPWDEVVRYGSFA
jgi:nitroreductase